MSCLIEGASILVALANEVLYDFVTTIAHFLETVSKSDFITMIFFFQ